MSAILNKSTILTRRAEFSLKMYKEPKISMIDQVEKRTIFLPF
jgi:hypothetical protein